MNLPPYSIPTDTQKLFDNLFKLKEKGISIIYISHHLEEIFKIADTVTVLRDGADTGSIPVKETDTDAIIRMMIGRELTDLYPVRDSEVGSEPIFEVKNLTAKDTLVHDVSFAVKPGEVLGIAGLGGSGRTETVKLIFGADKKKSGKLFLDGKEITTNSPADAVGYQIGLVSEDRKEEGVFLPLSILKNISVTNFKAISGKFGFISPEKESKNVQDLIDKLNIKNTKCRDRGQEFEWWKPTESCFGKMAQY